MHWQGYNYDRGVYYLSFVYILGLTAIAVVLLRLFTRIWLTRSVGSDDFAIIVSLVSIIVLAGFSMHAHSQYSSVSRLMA